MKLITESFVIKGMALEYLAEEELKNQNDQLSNKMTTNLTTIKQNDLDRNKNTIES